jgi:hypothetical protein
MSMLSSRASITAALLLFITAVFGGAVAHTLAYEKFHPVYAEAETAHCACGHNPNSNQKEHAGVSSSISHDASDCIICLFFKQLQNVNVTFLVWLSPVLPQRKYIPAPVTQPRIASILFFNSRAPPFFS